jgi:hypothetical protein
MAQIFTEGFFFLINFLSQMAQIFTDKFKRTLIKSVDDSNYAFFINEL